jgi:hypothetical protein
LLIFVLLFIYNCYIIFSDYIFSLLQTSTSNEKINPDSCCGVWGARICSLCNAKISHVTQEFLREGVRLCKEKAHHFNDYNQVEWWFILLKVKKKRCSKLFLLVPVNAQIAFLLACLFLYFKIIY